jgi:hypothetical protein
VHSAHHLADEANAERHTASRRQPRAGLDPMALPNQGKEQGRPQVRLSMRRTATDDCHLMAVLLAKQCAVSLGGQG